MMQTLSVWVGDNIIYLYGTVNNTEVTFTCMGDGVWQAIVPKAEDDVYIIFLQAYSANGFEYEGQRFIQVYSGWVEPKINWTHDDYGNWNDFNRQKHNVEYIATFVLPLLNVYPQYNAIEDVDLYSLPYSSLLNKLENNIEEIGRGLSLAYPNSHLTLQQMSISGKVISGQVFSLPARVPLLGDWKPSKKWVSEGKAPDYTDMNRWENNMLLVYEWAKQNPLILSMKPSGSFVAGQINFLPRMVI